MRRAVAMLPVAFAGLVLASMSVLAQSNWTGGGARLRERRPPEGRAGEAERAERRKSYGPVVYPKHHGRRGAA